MELNSTNNKLSESEKTTAVTFKVPTLMNDVYSVVSGDFTDEEIILLKDYHSNITKLLDCKIIKDNLLINTNFEIKCNDMSGLSCNATNLDDYGDYTSAFIHKLRFFMLSSERSSYNKISGILKRKLRDDRVHKYVEMQRDIYDGNKNNTPLSIECETEGGKTLVTSDTIVMTWLNAFEYHNDETKIKKFDKINEVLSYDFVKLIVIQRLVKKVDAICKIDDLISTMYI